MTETRTYDLNVNGQYPKKVSDKQKSKKKSTSDKVTKSSTASASSMLSEQERMEDAYKGKKTRKIYTYDKETGYLITSVFPVLSQEECKEQAVSITEEIRWCHKMMDTSKVLPKKYMLMKVPTTAWWICRLLEKQIVFRQSLLMRVLNVR